MSRSKFNPWLIAAFVGGISYPLLTYWGIDILPSRFFVFLGLSLIGIRLLGMQKTPDAKIWNIAFLIAAAGLIGMMLINARLATLIYPVVVNLCLLTIFGLSLLFPPTLVERIARFSEPNLPPGGVTYTRRVTMIWTVFLLLNSTTSLYTVIWGTLAQWTLWNGFISYLLIGALFVSELIVRKVVRP